jgi:hypothetical protein
LVPLITGLLSLSLGGAGSARPASLESGLVIRAPYAQDLATRLQLATGVASPEADPAEPADLLKALAIPEDLVSAVGDIACHLSRSRGAKFASTSRAPYAPVLFVAVTIGPCPN